MKKWLRTGFFILIINCKPALAQTKYNNYVNPFIGTGGHGHTFPGAVLPFGMVQLSPDTRVDGSWDGCSGYHYSDSIIYGFSHTHLSGTGVSDWGDILLMPASQVSSMDQKSYASLFSHTTEKASPGFYEVTLRKDKIAAALTVTTRTGIHRYTFLKAKNQVLLIDLLHRDKTLDCDLKLLDSVTVSGYRISEAWALEQHEYFVMKLSKPIKRIRYAKNKQLKDEVNRSTVEKMEGATLEFDAGDEPVLMVKVAISSVSEEGAVKNLQAEAPHWNFEKYKTDAEQAWDKELQKIEVSDTDKNKLAVFYTALYHCFIHPSLNMDVDGRYRGRDQKIHTAEGFTNYSVFSLWDTYRALKPLLTIVQPSKTRDFINTFLAQYKQAGRLPVWELSGNETDCMIGFHSVSVIADAITKGIRGFDTTLAYEAMKAASNDQNYGVPLFNKYGFLQVDDESESVSKTLEYGYDNWCIARIARLMGKKEDEALYFRRAQAYRNLFDDSTGLMRPRKNGNWLRPFYGSEINNHFTEGNSWQYSFYVPHDISGLIGLHGGKVNFEKKLDQLFTTSEKTKGREQADVTGLIGQYAHGNEPSHHMAYLYNYVGAPHKTVKRVQQICKNFYFNRPDGLIGNEDCGQMSAWYVFSAMGLYPVCPASEEYVLGLPLFKTIKINLDNGNTFLISNATLPAQNISAVQLNNKINLRPALADQSIITGGTLQFQSSSENEGKGSYGRGKYCLQSLPDLNPVLIPAPLINSPTQVFKNQLVVKIAALNKGNECTYTTDGSEPTRTSKKYIKPFVLDSNCVIKARAYSATDSSTVSTAVFYKIKYKYKVQLNSKANPQYAVEGAPSLIDGINGSTNWRKGSWLGFQGQDFECKVDLHREKDIRLVSLNTLQDTRSWIVFPSEVSFYGSTDDKNYELMGTAINNIKPDNYGLLLQKFETKSLNPKPVRYIKIRANNFGKLPSWHQGSGGDAFIFADEIEIE
ncbi:MAG: GH92 family glycosyl hydrolase [Bacteroidota bacterium]